MATRRIEVAPAQRANPWPWLAFLCLLGAALWLLTRPEPIPSVVDASYPAVVQPPQTPTPAEPTTQAVMVIITNTAAATDIPTAQPTAPATADVRINDCNRVTPGPKPGSSCVQQPALTPTKSPLPDCPTLPGNWCIWPANDETTSRKETG